jgi:hypothetical protein
VGIDVAVGVALGVSVSVSVGVIVGVGVMVGVSVNVAVGTIATSVTGALGLHATHPIMSKKINQRPNMPPHPIMIHSNMADMITYFMGFVLGGLPMVSSLGLPP